MSQTKESRLDPLELASEQTITTSSEFYQTSTVAKTPRTGLDQTSRGDTMATGFIWEPKRQMMRRKGKVALDRHLKEETAEEEDDHVLPSDILLLQNAENTRTNTYNNYLRARLQSRGKNAGENQRMSFNKTNFPAGQSSNSYGINPYATGHNLHQPYLRSTELLQSGSSDS